MPGDFDTDAAPKADDGTGGAAILIADLDPIDHYGDGDWYDAEYVHIKGDIPYYRHVAGSVNGPLLELACGTGRLTLPMADAGATVVGVDASLPMLTRARTKQRALPASVRNRLSFRHADMRTVRLERRFAGIVLAFNTIMHMLTDDDLAAVLATAHVHLRDGGRFFVDLHTPMTDLLDRDSEGRFDPQQMVDPKTGFRYIVTENNSYDPRQQINTMRFYYQRVDGDGVPIGAERYTEVQLRVLFPREIDRWLKDAGFEVLEDWDDFGRTQPFTGRGGRRVLVAARR